MGGLNLRGECGGFVSEMVRFGVVYEGFVVYPRGEANRHF